MTKYMVVVILKVLCGRERQRSSEIETLNNQNRDSDESKASNQNRHSDKSKSKSQYINVAQRLRCKNQSAGNIARHSSVMS